MQAKSAIFQKFFRRTNRMDRMGAQAFQPVLLRERQGGSPVLRQKNKIHKSKKILQITNYCASMEGVDRTYTFTTVFCITPSVVSNDDDGRDIPTVFTMTSTKFPK